jgi:hypothetical protein
MGRPGLLQAEKRAMEIMMRGSLSGLNSRIQALSVRLPPAVPEPNRIPPKLVLGHAPVAHATKIAPNVEPEEFEAVKRGVEARRLLGNDERYGIRGSDGLTRETPFESDRNTQRRKRPTAEEEHPAKEATHRGGGTPSEGSDPPRRSKICFRKPELRGAFGRPGTLTDLGFADQLGRFLAGRLQGSA